MIIIKKKWNDKTFLILNIFTQYKLNLKNVSSILFKIKFRTRSVFKKLDFDLKWRFYICHFNENYKKWWSKVKKVKNPKVKKKILLFPTKFYADSICVIYYFMKMFISKNNAVLKMKKKHSTWGNSLNSGLIWWIYIIFVVIQWVNFKTWAIRWIHWLKNTIFPVKTQSGVIWWVIFKNRVNLVKFCL